MDANQVLDAHVLELVRDGVVLIGADDSVAYVNSAASRLIGWPAAQARGRSIDEIVCAFDEEGAPVSLERRARASIFRNLSLLRPDGEICRVIARLRRLHSSECEGYVILLLRAHSRVDRLIRRLGRQNLLDPMTGLLNKSGLEREIEKRRHARNRWVAEVHINAMMHAAWSGSNAFDTLVHRVARVFSIRTDIVEVAARVSEKCFGLVIEARSSEQAETICERLSLLVENIEVEGVRLTCSIGIVQIDPSHDAPSIVEAAHVAAEIAAQHSDPEIHLMELNDVAVQRFQKAANVQGVVDSILHHDRIAIFCQPLVPLGECSEMGDRFELLTRIVDEEGRHISACELIADAEANGLAGKIDRAIVRKSFECLYRVYGGSGERRLACASINISASSLGDEALLEIVTTELKRGIIDPGKVCFEITESSSIKDPADAKAFIARMRQCGCSFSLDDFGSESASFVRLLDLGYIEYLKIDGALIQRIDQDPLAFDVVKSISDIAHRMGMRTVAEYVDRESLMSQLRHVGVDFAQGYLVGQPLPFK